MAAFATSNFDWSSMINEQLQQQPRSMIKIEQMEQLQQQQQQLPLNTMSDNSNGNTALWFDDFLNHGGNEDATTNQLPSNTASTTTGSPLEFSSLFDVDSEIQQQSQPQSLFSSTVTSLDNSPMMKAEEGKLQEMSQLDLDQSTISRTDSCVTLSSDCSANDESTTTKGEKPKKKRAPRKRLTAHQKQAHNKIEKRYRININAKIAGLQQIIPWVASEKTAFETGDAAGAKVEESTDVPRLNKSMILEKATSYILFLQEKEQKMEAELAKLREEVVRLGGANQS